MKLATFEKNGQHHLGVVLEQRGVIIALQVTCLGRLKRDCQHFRDMLSFLRGGADAIAQAQETVDYVEGYARSNDSFEDVCFPLDKVTLLSPVPVPESIRDFMAFEAHILNATRKAGFTFPGGETVARIDEQAARLTGGQNSLAGRLNKIWYEQPVYYKSNRFSVIGHGAETIMPRGCKQFDYELEWGVFIGKQGRNIPVEQARDYIGGYAIFNDFSARDLQLPEMKGRLGPAMGKDFDTGNAIGPWLVTPDEIADPYNLEMVARVDGIEYSRGNSRDMYWRFEQIISYLSQTQTLYPGEFIGSGTCSGARGKGCGLEQGRFLQAGHVVELEVQGLGILRNTVVADVE